MSEIIYRLSKKNMEKIRDALYEEERFVRRYRKEDKEELVEVFNVPPSTIELDKNELKIITKYRVSGLHVQSQLEELLKKLKGIK